MLLQISKNIKFTKKKGCFYMIKNNNFFDITIEGYYTKIDYIAGKIKNIIIEGCLSDLDIVEIKDIGIAALKLTDDTGSIMALFGAGSLEFEN